MNDDPTRVLLIEDDPGDARLIGEMLVEAGGGAFALVTADRLSAAIDQLADGGADVALLDLGLPDSSGLDTLARLHERFPQVPTLVLTGLRDEEVAARAVREGAEDYLVKDEVDAALLARSIRYAVDRKVAREALRQSEGKLNAILNAIGDHISMVDRDFTIVWANRTALRLFGDDIMGRKCYRVYHRSEEPCRPEQCAAARAFNDGHVHHLETMVRTRDGLRRWFDCTASVALRDGKGDPVTVIEVSRDVTDQKAAADELRRLNRTLRAVNECNRALLQAGEEQELLDRVCRAIVEVGGFRMAWVGYAEQDEARTVLPVAYADNDRCYLERAHISWADCETGRGPAGTAIRTGRPALSRDIATDPDFEPWRAAALACGYGSAIGLPLKSEEEVLGALNVYAEEPDAFDAGAMDLLAKLADNLAFGIDALRIDAARRHAEEELLKSNQRYRSMVQNAPIAICLIARDFAIIDANRTARRWFPAIDAEEAQPICFEVCQDRPRRGPCKECPVARTFGDGRVHEAVIGKTVGGQERRYRAISSPVRDARGNVVAALEMVEDMSERLRAIQELQQERNFSQAVLDTAGALIVVLDTEGRILRFNKACEEVTGFCADQMEGRRIWEVLIPPDQQPGVREVFGQLVGQTESSTYENEWLTSEGGRRLIAWANTRVLDQDGEVRWVVATGIDVTEHRQLEAQLRRAAKLEAVGRLAGGVAHDFNNLLTAIIGYVDLNLPQMAEESQIRGDMLQVRQAAGRAADLARQLLTFSRRQASRAELLDLNKAVASVAKMARHWVEESVEVSLVLHDGPLMVRADPAQIEQVLMNLIVNARDAMPEGGALIIETAAVELDEVYVAGNPGARTGQHAVLSVSDTGTGMTPEVRDKMFEPFFTTKEVGEGTGLGLSTVYGIVEQHEGHITCYSEPGMGTTFKIHLPLREGDETATETDPEQITQFGHGEVILLAEDEAAVRSLAARALSEAGYEVLAAPDGPAALELLDGRARPVDLLLTDMVMPKMSGPELAQEVRLRAPRAKLLFMSGYVSRSPEDTRHQAPGQPVVQKPFTARILARKVRRVLDRP